MEEGKGATAPWDTTADGDEAESVRVRFRERVSGPCWEDGEVEPADHPPGGVGVAAPLSFFRPAAWKSSSGTLYGQPERELY